MNARGVVPRQVSTTWGVVPRLATVHSHPTPTTATYRAHLKYVRVCCCCYRRSGRRTCCTTAGRTCATGVLRQRRPGLAGAALLGKGGAVVVDVFLIHFRISRRGGSDRVAGQQSQAVDGLCVHPADHPLHFHVHLRRRAATVTSRPSTLVVAKAPWPAAVPRWRVCVRALLRTCAPRGCIIRVVSRLTKSRKTPTHCSYFCSGYT